jgi:preprotein translocase subunit SecA
MGMPKGEPLVHPWISKALEKAQQKVEERNFDIRKNLLKYDNVMNDQRKVVYEQRRELMMAEDVSDTVRDMRAEYLGDVISTYIQPGTAPNEGKIDELKQEIGRITGFLLPVDEWSKEAEIDSDVMEQRIVDTTEKLLQEKTAGLPEEIVHMVEKNILLQVLDQLWKDHIAALDLMRHTIVLRAYGQRDPLNEYKKEAFNMFSDLLSVLKERVTVVICHTVIQTETEQQMQRAMDKEQNRKMSAFHDGAITADEDINADIFANVGRNDPCPCGSGKKFKHCHGRLI